MITPSLPDASPTAGTLNEISVVDRVQARIVDTQKILLPLLDEHITSAILEAQLTKAYPLQIKLISAILKI